MTSMTLSIPNPIMVDAKGRVANYFRENSSVVKAALRARAYWRSDLEPYSSN